jgi:ankyrin repeat protein
MNNYALKWVSENGHTEVVRLLLEYKANVHVNNNYALRYSSENGHIEIVRLLLEKGEANVYADNNYPLRWVSDRGHTGVVRVLLENGANVHARDNCALILSSQNGDTGLVKLFLSKSYHHTLMDEIITENFYDWIQEFPIPLGFKRTVTMKEGVRRYLSNENWIKGNRKPTHNFTNITILVN